MRRASIFLLILMGCLGISCNKQPNPGKDENTLDISGVKFPVAIEAHAGDRVSVEAPAGRIRTTDIVRFKAATGQASYDCKVVKVAAASFTFQLTDDILSGRYICHILRDAQDKAVGTTTLTILNDVEVDPEGANVYGRVACGGQGIPDVVVSDGIEVITTDKDGIYRMNSSKELGVVFISIPSGYEVPASGVLPQFHHYLDAEHVEKAERADFTLVKVNNDKHKVLVMGDIHLANRNNDRTEFRKFTSDVLQYQEDHPGEKIYGLTLGDMTWDAYWYTNSYYFPQYLADIKPLSGMLIFHTIGNHDHDMKAAGDVLTMVEYVKDIAPDYYSFNLGKVHYVVLDNIVCQNDGSGTSASRKYAEQVTAAQYAWLRKDLSFVSKDTPVVVSMHAPIYRDNGSSTGLTPYAGLSGWSTLVGCFNGFSTVHFLTGHTHRSLNVAKGSYFEHNAGAVCASWWWSQKCSAGFDVCTDGTPGGYTIWEVDGTDMKWLYKGTKENEDFQFRTYDLNNVCFDATAVGTWLPSGSDWARERFVSYYGKKFPKSSDNEILVNVWNYDPTWTIKAVEKLSSGDKTLTVTQLQTYDPLHILCLSAKRFNDNITSDPNFISNLTTHMFKVKASDASSTVEFSVTDRFGHTWTETMTRPKPFDLNTYKTGYAK